MAEQQELVNLTIDGRPVRAPKGAVIWAAAQQFGDRGADLLLPPAHGPARRLSHVLRRGQGHAEAGHRLHDDGE